MPSKDEEIRRVVAEADSLMDQLQANVAALAAMLTQPPNDDCTDGQEVPVL